MTGLRINVGCGQFPLDGWINVDVDPRAKADVWHNLNDRPYPFETASADAIVASHVLEHLQEPFAVMAEFNRILRPGGRLTVRVPHFSRGIMHPDHKRGFDVTFPLYFDPSFRGGYSGTTLESRGVRLRWFAQAELKRDTLGPTLTSLASGLGGAIDWLARLSPYVASRVWCFWVGGFEEVEFVFIKPAEGCPATDSRSRAQTAAAPESSPAARRVGP
ncbi:MAG: class I SAM-dependent methyltransferase [Acidobacteriota bacterium]